LAAGTAGETNPASGRTAQQVAEGQLRFPPVVLFTDGRDHCLGDGFYRVLAARKAGLTEIAAELRPGTLRDAALFGISANSGHGLPRTNANKRKPSVSSWPIRNGASGAIGKSAGAARSIARS
jgi:hypothetical protein